jgi:hypothetical protein
MGKNQPGACTPAAAGVCTTGLVNCCLDATLPLENSCCWGYLDTSCGKSIDEKGIHDLQ